MAFPCQAVLPMGEPCPWWAAQSPDLRISPKMLLRAGCWPGKEDGCAFQAVAS